MTPSTIALKPGDGGGIRKEGTASEAITPGHLIEFGGSNDLQKHSSQNGAARRAFAVENDLVGEDVDDAYDAGDTVQYDVYPQGAEVYAWLAYGQNITTVGAALVSNGDGTLKAAAGSDDHRTVAYALEAVNASAADARIKVEVA